MAAATIDVLDSKGEKVGTVDLPEELFARQVSVPLLHQVVVAQRAAARQGTHKAKNRGERSGSGRKPFKQKGTGNARQGSVRMPQHRGGGIVHGPVPRNYAQRTPKKMIAAALLQSLSDRAAGDRIHVLAEVTATEVPSTRAAVAALGHVASGKTALVVVSRDDELTRKSVRNLPQVRVLSHDQLNAYDVLVSDDIVFLKDALDAFISTKLDTGVSSKPDTADATEQKEQVA